MAKRVSVQLVDDYDGESVAEETVEFGLDGHTYEIDLNSEHASQIRGDLRKWVSHARRSGTRKPGRAARVRRQRQMSAEESSACREWARQQGYAVAGRGRIPQKIIGEFRESTGTAQ